MAGRPRRRAKETHLQELRDKGELEDAIARPFPLHWRTMSVQEHLETMLGYSLTIGMEVLTWGPLRLLTPNQLAEVDRVRHDVMMLAGRIGIETGRKKNLEEMRDLAAAIARHDDAGGSTK